MARCYASALFLALAVLTDFVGWGNAMNCITYKSSSVLTVPKGTTCELTSDINAEIVNIFGEATAPESGAKVFTIICTNLTIEAGGKLSLTRSGHGSGVGPGAGTVNGSGGQQCYH